MRPYILVLLLAMMAPAGAWAKPLAVTLPLQRISASIPLPSSVPELQLSIRGSVIEALVPGDQGRALTLAGVVHRQLMAQGIATEVSCILRSADSDRPHRLAVAIKGTVSPAQQQRVLDQIALLSAPSAAKL